MARWYSLSSSAQSGQHVAMWGHGSDVSSVAQVLTISVKAMKKYYRKHVVPLPSAFSKTTYESCCLTLSRNCKQISRVLIKVMHSASDLIKRRGEQDTLSLNVSYDQSKI